jgi:hypothetical protein
LLKPETPVSKPPTEPAIDAFDDDAEQAQAEATSHGHVLVPTTYTAGTGNRLRIFAVGFGVLLAVAFFVVNRVKGGKRPSSPRRRPNAPNSRPRSRWSRWSRRPRLRA